MLRPDLADEVTVLLVARGLVRLRGGEEKVKVIEGKEGRAGGEKRGENDTGEG